MEMEQHQKSKYINLYYIYKDIYGFKKVLISPEHYVLLVK